VKEKIQNRSIPTDKMIPQSSFLWKQGHISIWKPGMKKWQNRDLSWFRTLVTTEITCTIH
jgi:hypothetical protein